MGNVAEVEEKIRGELARMQPVVEEITGLRSRWNGRLELVPNPGFRGKKPFSCAIVLDAALVGEEVRWRTSLHELLHAVSVGYVPSDYRALRGWEEGVVEQLQRLIRPVVLARIDVVVPEEVFRVAEEDHPFNPHIEALETLRQELELPELDFYLNLLRTPIRRRPTVVFEWRNNLPNDQRREFAKTFVRAHATLRG